MPFTPDSEIEDQEILYRRISPLQWKWDEDRPSSALFKDRNGVSVDRDGERTEEECINFLIRDNKDNGACTVNAEAARSIGTYLKPEPLNDNIYHSLILNSADKPRMTDGKAKALVRASNLHKKPDPIF